MASMFSGTAEEDDTSRQGFPSGHTVLPKVLEWEVAPTVMASGLVPGDWIVEGSGPELPAAITTTTPKRVSVAIRCWQIS